MATIITATLVEGAVLLCIIALCFLAVLAFRNPHRSKFLRKEIVEIVVVTVWVSAFVFAIALMINSLVDAGAGVLMAVILTTMLGVGAGGGLLWVFGVRERLRRADAGESPFYAWRAKR